MILLMRSVQRILWGLALLALPSCAVAVVAGVGVGAAVMKYAENEFARDYVLDVPDVWSAVVEALRENSFEVPADAEPGLEGGEIETDEVWVQVKRFPGEFTRLRVRVGSFHSVETERRALAILDSTSLILARRPVDLR